MRLTELGDIGPQALLFGGPEANLQAFQRLRKVIETQGTPARAVICTGGLVGLGGDVGPVVEQVREFGCQVVAGAGDLAAARATGGSVPVQQASAILLPDAKAWLSGRPEALSFVLAGKRYLVLAGVLGHPERGLWPTDSDDRFAEEISRIRARIGDVDGVISGWGGVPFHRRADSVDWINPGSTGRPPHDGQAQGRFVLLAPDHARFLCLPYDVAGAQAAMRRVGRSDAEIDTLASGWWSDETSLPEAMRRQVSSASSSV